MEHRLFFGNSRGKGNYLTLYFYKTTAVSLSLSLKFSRTPVLPLLSYFSSFLSSFLPFSFLLLSSVRSREIEDERVRLRERTERWRSAREREIEE